MERNLTFSASLFISFDTQSPEKEDLQVDTQVDTSDEYHSDHEGNAVAPDVQGIESPPAEQER